MTNKYRVYIRYKVDLVRSSIIIFITCIINTFISSNKSTSFTHNRLMTLEDIENIENKGKEPLAFLNKYSETDHQVYQLCMT